MYYIRKSSEQWVVYNQRTKKRRFLDPLEVESLLEEFPNLKLNNNSQSLTYFRNHIRSIPDLP